MPRYLITYRLDVPQVAEHEMKAPTESVAREWAARLLEDEDFRTRVLHWRDGEPDKGEPITVDSVDVIEED